MVAFAHDGLTVTVTVTPTSSTPQQPSAGSPHPSAHLPVTGAPVAALLVLAFICVALGAALYRLGKPTHGYR
jgi:hypothetical protein